MTQNDLLDAVVVGGGPAGLAAALTLGRASRRTLVLDSGAYRNAPAAHMQNVLGWDGRPPSELRAAGRRDLERYPAVEVRDVAVASAERSDGALTVVLADGATVRARRLILATGVVDDLPDIPGLAELWGRSVLHCPYCHGYEVRGKALAVLGGTDAHAFVATLLRRSYSSDVVLLTDGEDAPAPDTLAAEGVAVVTRRVARLDARDGVLSEVVFADGSTLERDAIFRGGPVLQRSTLAADLGCAFAGPLVEVDDFGRTTVPGVLAVGDMAMRPVMPGPQQSVAVAATAGMAAGVIVDQELNAEDTGLPTHFPPRQVLTPAP